jgi:hypothetical protein
MNKTREARRSITTFSEEEQATFKKALSEQLLLVTDICKTHNVHYWIDCGTLLGLYRDGDIIRGDYDNDIGIFGEDITCKFITDITSHINSKYSKQSYSIDELRAALDGKMSVMPKSIRFNNTEHAYFGNIVYPETDIFVWNKYGSERFVKLCGQLVMRIDCNKLGNFCQLETKYGTFTAPEHIEEYLVDYYGDWKTPIPTEKYHDKMSGYFGTKMLEDVGFCPAIDLTNKQIIKVTDWETFFKEQRVVRKQLMQLYK